MFLHLQDSVLHVLHMKYIYMHVHCTYMYYIVCSSGNFFMSAVLLSAKVHQTN